jgi:HEAT repeat protein
MAGDTPTRSRLLWIAGQLGEIGAPILLSALDDPVFWMRGRAAEHLGRLGISEAGELVSRLLRDPHPWTRGCAAAAVGRLKHAGVLEALIPLLDDEAGRPQGPTSVDRVMTLGGPARVVPFLSHDQRELRIRAIELLGKHGYTPAAKALITRMRDDDWVVRGLAAGALGRVGGRAAYAALSSALMQETSWVRALAAQGLGDLGDPKALAGLLAALRSEDGLLRAAVFWALGRLGAPGVVEALRRGLDDEHPSARLRALEALVRLGKAPEMRPSDEAALAELPPRPVT